tara:strand:+ start:2665 stop:3153 length:489 start_codon:yes stop_codon:yes gene_type:complete
MPWKLGTKTINLGRSWTDSSGNQYPSNWLALTTDAEKKAVGLKWEADPTPFDSRFYLSAGNPRDVAELKTAWIANTKNTADSLLSPTDWYIIRKAEDSTTTIPTDVATYRAAVRTASGKIETSITNAADHAAFIALWNTPVDSEGKQTGNAPINDWPEPLIG